MWGRIHRLFYTFIAKKYVAWIVANWFLFAGKISGTDWVMFTAAIFCIDAYSKYKGVPNVSAGNPME